MNKPTNTARIYLARHCKTIWNLENRLVGISDVPLCPEGLAEAKATTSKIENLGVNRIVCSPLKRAHETAKIYAEHLRVPLHVCDGLREIDHGSWNGQKLIELLDDPKSDFKQWFADPATISIPDGTEPIEAAQRRIVGTIRKIALKYPSETVLVVMHKHIRSILRCALYDMELKHFRANIDDSVEPIEIPQELLLRIL
jgi:Fructose-2,6-bisphosphatase